MCPGGFSERASRGKGSATPERSGVMGKAQRRQEQQALKLLQQGNIKEAERIYRTLISEGVSNWAVFGNLAQICGMEGKTGEMIAFYRRALAINPNLPDAWCNLGIALQSQDDAAAAVDAFRRALAIQPGHPGMLCNLGRALQQQGDAEGAIDACRQALATDPCCMEALLSLGHSCWQQGDMHAAADAYRRALAIEPRSAAALANLGNVLLELGEVQAAIDACRRAVAMEPGAVHALCNLSNALRVQGSLREAAGAAEQALAVCPDSPDALSNLGSAVLQEGDPQAAIALFRRALASDANHAHAHRNLSLALLLAGDYHNGLKEYEWRFQVRGCNMLYGAPSLEPYTGDNLAEGEPLILVSELGLGDTLQFMRYIPYLQNAGLSIALCAPTKLHGLIRSSGITAALHGPDEASQLTCGKWLPLMSLPRHLRITPGNALVDAPYIRAPEPLVDRWQQKLAAEGRPVIGINWQGNTGPGEVGDWRSLPLAAFGAVCEQPSVRLLSLQKGSGSEQLAHCPFRHRFVGCQEEICGTWDFAATAAIIASCDLVISSDTAVAHLAAGMGRPTWLLLSKVPEWRWGLSGDTTFWYPAMRLFRQQERGNWLEVMERVAAALKREWA